MKRVFRRPVLAELINRLSEPRRFIQVLAGPRQTGKTTLARQGLEDLGLPNHYSSADQPAGRDLSWLEAQWEIGRQLSIQDKKQGAVLVLDEAQKIHDWSEAVKRLWDEDTARKLRLKVVLLGSAPLLVQRGLSESLAGRFELIRVNHWSFSEMRDAFGFDLDRYLFFGGYPGAASLTKEYERWSAYILDSLVETTLSRDLLLLTPIEKPALLRQLFRLACDYSAQILSYSKMLGQLQDAGNTVTLANYLRSLGDSGLVRGVEKFSGSRVRQRGSSPKLLALNSALISAHQGLTMRQARSDKASWGRLIETAVGAHIVNTAGPRTDTFYWRHRNREVDYVVRSGQKLIAIEVAGGSRKDSLPGMTAFCKEFRCDRKLLVGGQGIGLSEFLSESIERWLQ